MAPGEVPFLRSTMLNQLNFRGGRVRGALTSLEGLLVKVPFLIPVGAFTPMP